MRRARQGGFTLIEIMVSLVVVIIGLLGIMALQATTVKANRLSRGLERAKVYASQVMEDLRSKDTTTLGTSGGYPDITTSDGVVYHRSYTVAGVTGSTTMVVITSTATFLDDNDGSTHAANLQMVRTTQEKL